MKYIFIHGSGHKSTSWGETISFVNEEKPKILAKILNEYFSETK